jgi:protoheme IX farnesyltransferase
MNISTAGVLADYYTLTKPKVVATLVFTAIVGMLLALPPGVLPWPLMGWSTLGIALAAASGAAFNHLLDRHVDAQMQRTVQRPLPTGRLSAWQTLWFAAILAVLGFVVLVACVNTLTAVLTLLALVGYAGFYTAFLKRATPQNIVIGGAAGAAPPLLGWTAMTGQVDAQALLLFLIVFLWTPPHFWALAIARMEDYRRAGIPMLPVTHGIAYTCQQIMLYTILLCAITMLPFAIGMSGLFYLAGTLVLDGVYLVKVIGLQGDPAPRRCMAAFGYSVIYLLGLFGLLLIDHMLL